ncbi:MULTISPECIES: helix-turn-helix transcriptional regulator [unclassified Microbacterium]|uniref:helix-turn-helix transcriptional regulator n=1 Tax=unclassified Microbacterium TaxID=2609290 RepID=UPI00301049A8
MTAERQPRQYLPRAEVAAVARRSESTIRNWIRDGVLRPVRPGWFDRDEVLAAEREMRGRRRRPTTTAPRVLQVAPGTWVEVAPCGAHTPALDGGLIALTCKRCVLRTATPNRPIRHEDWCHAVTGCSEAGHCTCDGTDRPDGSAER